MKLKFLILGLFLSTGLLFSLPVFADIPYPENYERTPADYTISNPVNFFIHGTYDDLRSICGGAQFNNWRIRIWGEDIPAFNSFEVASTTTNQNFLMTIPLGTYTMVYLQCQKLDGVWTGGGLEHNMMDEPIFEVIEAPPPPPTGGNIITMPTGFATSALAYAGQIFTDTSSLILIGIGLLLAFWVINKILVLSNVLEKVKIKKSEDFFSKHKSEKDDWL